MGIGGLRSFSDRVGELDDWGMDTVRALLAGGGTANVFSPDRIATAARLARNEASS
jgi:alpha-galactosidase